ncbi:MAG: DUF3825 domain-containing protein [Vicinamibacterales bacterium]
MFEQDELVQELGDGYTNEVVKRLHRFVFLPPKIVDQLAGEALSENWGNDRYVLAKYLAVHIPWSIEQGRFTQSSNQFYTTAGHLQTRYGTPLYLVFAKNALPGPKWRVIAAGSQISAPELPTPPDIPAPPAVPQGAEVVMLHEHILGERADRVPFLKQTPSVAQMCAVSGAIQWSLNRHLELPYWYFGKMNYLVPLYLQSREDITLAPDLIAPIQVNPDSLMVRTVLEPAMPYANARVAVRRHDQLPHWLLDGWNAFSAKVSTAQVEDPEKEVSDDTPVSKY